MSGPHDARDSHASDALQPTLLSLPRPLLRRVLMCVESEDVRALLHTHSGSSSRRRCTEDPHAADGSIVRAQKADQQLSSFLTGLISLLDDRELLHRESSVRSLRYRRMGYRAGLDQANERAEAEGLMQAPFTKGFQEGAESGWKTAFAQGIIAGLACFTHRAAATRRLRGQTNDDATADKIAHINNKTNAKVSNDRYMIRHVADASETDRSHLTTTDSLLSPLPQLVLIPIKPVASSTSTHGTVLNSASGVASSCSSGDCSCATSESTDVDPAMPPLIPADANANADAGESHTSTLDPLVALSQLRPMLPSVGLDSADVEKYLQLPPIGAYVHERPEETNELKPMQRNDTATAAVISPRATIEASQMAALDW